MLQRCTTQLFVLRLQSFVSSDMPKEFKYCDGSITAEELNPHTLERVKVIDAQNSVLSWGKATKPLEVPIFTKFGPPCHTPDIHIKDSHVLCPDRYETFITGWNQRYLDIAAASKHLKYTQHRFYQVPSQPEVPNAKFQRYKNSHGSFVRITEDTLFAQMAALTASRSTCLRKKVGAVFTDSRHQRVLCFGYNGNVAGGPNECDSLEEGVCGCLHAETNALTKSVDSLEGSTCFVTLSPCMMCAKLLINRGVGRVVYNEQYRDLSGIELLEKHDVKTEFFGRKE